MLFKRSIVGAFRKISVKHLDAYLQEQEFRINNRDNPHAFREVMKRILGRRASLFRTHGGEENGLMAIYTYTCPSGDKTERRRLSAQRDDAPLCRDCGARTTRVGAPLAVAVPAINGPSHLPKVIHVGPEPRPKGSIGILITNFSGVIEGGGSEGFDTGMSVVESDVDILDANFKGNRKDFKAKNSRVRLRGTKCE